jgi:ubiquitin-protein ligase
LTGSYLFIPKTTSDIDHVFQNEAFFNSALREYKEFSSEPPEEMITRIESHVPRSRLYNDEEEEGRNPPVEFVMPEEMIADPCVRSKPFNVEWLHEPLADPYGILETWRNNSPTTIRDSYLVDDLFQIAQRADPWLQVYVNLGRMWEWCVLLHVEEGSYAGFWFQLVLKFGVDYPYTGPEIRFIDPPYHVNISNHGRIIPEIEYVENDRVLGLLSKIRTFLVTKPVGSYPVDNEHAVVFQDQAQYAQKIQEANEQNGKRAPEDFTSDWNIKLGNRNAKLRRRDLNAR